MPTRLVVTAGYFANDQLAIPSIVIRLIQISFFAEFTCFMSAINRIIRFGLRIVWFGLRIRRWLRNVFSVAQTKAAGNCIERCPPRTYTDPTFGSMDDALTVGEEAFWASSSTVLLIPARALPESASGKLAPVAYTTLEGLSERLFSVNMPISKLVS